MDMDYSMQQQESFRTVFLFRRQRNSRQEPRCTPILSPRSLQMIPSHDRMGKEQVGVMFRRSLPRSCGDRSDRGRALMSRSGGKQLRLLLAKQRTLHKVAILLLIKHFDLCLIDLAAVSPSCCAENDVSFLSVHST